MAKLIDKHEVIKAICEIGCGTNTMCDAPCSEVQAVLEFPGVEAKPVRHGHWIDETFKPTGLVFHPYVCDQCGCHSESNFTYCPDCGARMDEVT